MVVREFVATSVDLETDRARHTGDMWLFNKIHFEAWA